MQENVNVLERGGSMDKKLLLVVRACDAIAYVLGALDDYVSTDERSFLGLAADARQLMASVKKYL